MLAREKKNGDESFFQLPYLLHYYILLVATSPPGFKPGTFQDEFPVPPGSNRGPFKMSFPCHRVTDRHRHSQLMTGNVLVAHGS